MSFDTVDMLDIEIARTGTWDGANGRFEMTPQHFEDAVQAAADPEVGNIPLKWGHTSTLNAGLGDGAPAYGWVTGPRVADLPTGGKSLRADLRGIPAKYAGLIGRAFKQRSIEMRLGVKTPSGKTYSAALVGLALLGASAPAVKGMEDLAALYASSGPVEDDTTDKGTVTVILSEDQNHETTPTAYTERVSDKTAPQAKATGEPKTEETATMATLTPEALKSLGLDENATPEDVETAITALAAKVETAPAENDGENVDKAPKPAETPVVEAEKVPVAASEGGVKTVTLSEGVYEDMKSQLSVLMSEKVERENAALLTDALSTGKIAAADKPSIEALLSESPEAGRKFLATLQPGRVNMSEAGAATARPAHHTTPDEAADAALDAILGK